MRWLVAVEVGGYALGPVAVEAASAQDARAEAEEAVRNMTIEAVCAVPDDIPHAGYPHHPGYLHDCPACEAACHCTLGSAECVFEGRHNGLAAT